MVQAPDFATVQARRRKKRTTGLIVKVTGPRLSKYDPNWLPGAANRGGLGPHQARLTHVAIWDCYSAVSFRAVLLSLPVEFKRKEKQKARFLQLPLPFCISLPLF